MEALLMHNIEKTTLFKSVPRNYWPDLYKEIDLLGAASKKFNIKIVGHLAFFVYSIDLDLPLINAFVWLRSEKGQVFWRKVWEGTLDAGKHPAV